MNALRDYHVGINESYVLSNATEVERVLITRQKNSFPEKIIRQRYLSVKK